VKGRGGSRTDGAMGSPGMRGAHHDIPATVTAIKRILC